VALAVAAVVASLPLFAVGGVAAGGGVGLLFRSALSRVTAGRPEARGEILAAIFLIAYAGLCVPVLLVGGALVFFPPQVVLLVFVALVLAAVVVSALRMLRQR
jgi:hypothetical protein